MGKYTCDLRHGRWQDALGDVESCDAVIVDAPYSARTHGGHDGAPTVGDGFRVSAYDPRYHTSSGRACPNVTPKARRAIDYDGWTDAEVYEHVAHWSPRCTGWFVSITDHVLAMAWDARMSEAGRYVFSPVPWVAPGSRVRLSGDGPSSWTCYAIVGRPRTGTFRDGTAANKWGTLPGAYIETQDRNIVVGGKPLALMRALIRDYTRPGDLVVDTCAGGATTLLAAALEGRHAIGSEMDPETFTKASERLRHHLPTQARWQKAHDDAMRELDAKREAKAKGREYVPKGTQASLFGEAS